MNLPCSLHTQTLNNRLQDIARKRRIVASIDRHLAGLHTWYAGNFQRTVLAGVEHVERLVRHEMMATVDWLMDAIRLPLIARRNLVGAANCRGFLAPAGQP